jgi:hypothetical protein
MHVIYFIEADDHGWQVRSRGFNWRFASKEEATDFAISMAEAFAEASGRTTYVRRAEASGRVEELQVFCGVVPLVAAVANLALAARRPSGHG